VLRSTRTERGGGPAKAAADPALVDTDPGREAATIKVSGPGGAQGSDSKVGSGSGSGKRNLPMATPETPVINVNIDVGPGSGKRGRKSGSGTSGTRTGPAPVTAGGDSGNLPQAAVSTIDPSGPNSGVRRRPRRSSAQVRSWLMLAAITLGVFAALAAIHFLTR
jgi:hypothetical protein